MCIRDSLLICRAADTASLATWFLFGKLFGVTTLVGFDEKRCRKNLPLCDPDRNHRMSLSPELESALRDRVAEHILRESQGDVDALYEFIDPDIRESRAAKYDFEPEHTITQIREYTSRIQSAELVKFSISGYTDNGGDDRGNAPTAIVLVSVCYNNRETLSDFRTPWVLRSGLWFTRATGKISFPPTA